MLTLLLPRLTRASSCVAAAWLRSSNCASSGTPASRLLTMLSLASPSSACSQRSQTGPGVDTATGCQFSASVKSPSSLCGPLRQADSAGPRHQGSGSKRRQSPWPLTRQPAPSRWASSVNRARASPDAASACVSRSRVALTSPFSVSATGAPLPSSVWPVSWLCRLRWGLKPPAGATRPSGAGRPPAASLTGPDTRNAAARRSSRAGSRSVNCKLRSSCSPCQRPLPLAWPAGPAASPSVSAKCSNCRLSRCCGSTAICSDSLRSGTRPSS